MKKKIDGAIFKKTLNISLLSILFLAALLIAYVLLTFIILQIVPDDYASVLPWLAPTVQIFSIASLIGLCVLLLRSNLHENIKSAFLTAPIVYSVIYVQTAFQSPLLKSLSTAAVFLFAMGYVFSSQKSWKYYYSSFFAAIILVILSI